MNALAVGRIDGPHVVIDDTAQANRLHNKSHAGTPETGNTLCLDRVEATYCMERGWLQVPDHSVADLLAAGADDAQNEVDHLCYRDLRERGLTVRIQNGSMQVWNRGDSSNQEPWFTTHAMPERVPVTATDLADLAGDHVSIVDEDGAVTHYTVQAATPHGDMHAPEFPPMQGVRLDDRVLVTGSDAAAALADSFIGTPHGDARILSLTEAESLRRRGALQLPDDLADHARDRHDHFDTTLAVHDALQAAGVLTKSGFRFGTHLRGYAADPDTVHAEWLIHCAATDARLAWSDLSRGIRLAHGVRKRFLVAVADGPVRFVELAWFRP